jgi:hypothetical protein
MFYITLFYTGVANEVIMHMTYMIYTIEVFKILILRQAVPNRNCDLASSLATYMFVFEGYEDKSNFNQLLLLDQCPVVILTISRTLNTDIL